MGIGCNITSDTSLLIQLVVVIFVDGFGIVLTLFSLCLLALIKGIDPALREILISLQVANLLGGGVVTHDTVATLCGSNNIELTSISILLTAGHMVKLLVAEYTMLTSALKKGSSERFGGLIFSFWLLSVSVGLLSTSLPDEDERRAAYIIVSLGVIIIFSTVVAIYINYIRKYHWIRRRLLSVRRIQLDEKHRKHISPNQYGELKYVPFIYIWYFVFTLPWTVQRLYEGVSANEAPSYIRFAALLIFAFCFYFPALVPFHMWKRLRSRKIGPYETDAEDEHSPSAMTYITAILDKKSNAFGSYSPRQPRDEKSIFNYSYTHS